MLYGIQAARWPKGNDMVKPLKVELEWSLLERIAEYYQFPSAVFLGNKKMFKAKTAEEKPIGTILTKS